MVGAIAKGTGIPTSAAGLLTTLPLVAFGLISPLSPGFVRRWGIERSLFLGLLILTVGTVLRAAGSVPALLMGMFLIGAGIALGNVLLPSLVKRDFPHQIGLLTGLYSTVMNIFAALSSGISVPLSHISGLGWQGALASWALLSSLAMAFLLPQLKNSVKTQSSLHFGLWKSPVAWQITLFMGLQSFLFYVNVAWIPTLLYDRGMSLSQSGWMVSLLQFVSLPGSFVMPIVAGKRKSQRSLVLFISLLFLAGYLGLLLGSVSLSWIWMILIGLAGGASISLALMFFGLRSRNHDEAAELSGMAQSVGYLLAALGPVSIGILHHVTGTWTVPLWVLVMTVIVMLGFGLGAARDVYVSPPRDLADPILPNGRRAR